MHCVLSPGPGPQQPTEPQSALSPSAEGEDPGEVCGSPENRVCRQRTEVLPRYVNPLEGLKGLVHEPTPGPHSQGQAAPPSIFRNPSQPSGHSKGKLSQNRQELQPPEASPPKPRQPTPPTQLLRSKTKASPTTTSPYSPSSTVARGILTEKQTLSYPCLEPFRGSFSLLMKPRPPPCTPGPRMPVPLPFPSFLCHWDTPRPFLP